MGLNTTTIVLKERPQIQFSYAVCISAETPEKDDHTGNPVKIHSIPYILDVFVKEFHEDVGEHNTEVKVECTLTVS